MEIFKRDCYIPLSAVAQIPVIYLAVNFTTCNHCFMSADSKTTNSASDDIDLLLLIERGLLFFRKYKWIFIIAILLGVGSGIFVYRSLGKIYSSRMVVHPFILTNQEQIQIVENWNDLLGKREYAALAAAFNCPENIFFCLKKLKAEEIQKGFIGANPTGFTIEVNITNNSILDDLQKGIVYGFENNEYIRQRLGFKRAKLRELINKTSVEIQKLDSTKKIVETIIEGKRESSSSIIIDGSSINRQLIEMNEKLLNYQEDLKFTNAVQVLQSFGKFRQPVNPKLIPWLIIGLLFFLSLAFLYSLYSSIRGKLKKRLKLQSKE
jgi:hypothetical protein